MLINNIGNTLIGTTSRGETVKITRAVNKTISELNGTVREKTIREVPLDSEKNIFRKAFPQYNDFKMVLRRDAYKGNRSGTKYYGYLAGVDKNGYSSVLIRQSKNNSEFSDIHIGYNSSVSLPRNPSLFEGITVETYQSHNKKRNYTKIGNIFSRAYLRGDEKLKSTEKATDKFFAIMRKETK